MFFEIANTVIAVSVVGALISLSFLLPEIDGEFTDVANRTGSFLRRVSILWVFTSVGYFIATLARIFGSSISEVIDRKSTRLNSSHEWISRMPSSA